MNHAKGPLQESVHMDLGNDYHGPMRLLCGMYLGDDVSSKSYAPLLRYMDNVIGMGLVEMSGKGDAAYPQLTQKGSSAVDLYVQVRKMFFDSEINKKEKTF